MESEQLKIQVVTQLVAKRAEKRSKGGDVFEDGRSQPHADHLRLGIIVAEQLRAPTAFTNLNGPCRENPDPRALTL